MENLERNIVQREEHTVDIRLRYEQGEVPFEYNWTFPKGERLEAFQDKEGIGHIVIKKNGITIFDAQEHVPSGYILATPFYSIAHFGRGQELYAYQPGRWAVDHSRNFINLGMFRKPQDIFVLLHEIGHARGDTRERIKKLEELEGNLREAMRHNEKELAIIFNEEAAKLHSRIERDAWAYAIRALRALQKKGFDFRQIFPTLGELMGYAEKGLRNHGQGAVFTAEAISQEVALGEKLHRLYVKKK